MSSQKYLADPSLAQLNGSGRLHLGVDDLPFLSPLPPGRARESGGSTCRGFLRERGSRTPARRRTMIELEILDPDPALRGGYKVDPSRGNHQGRVSSEWFSRPDDERFLS